MSESAKILIPHLHVRQKSLDSAREVKEAIEGELPDVTVEIAESREDSLDSIVDTDVVVSKGITVELLDRADELAWIQGLSSGLGRFTTDRYGYEPPGLDRIEELGIVLTNTAGVHAEPISEQVLGYMLTFERNIHRGIRQQSTRTWESYHPEGELVGKTLGIIGVGAVGGRVAELGSAFDMEVLGTKRDTDSVTDAVDEIYGPSGVEELLTRSDYLVIACPLTDQTRDLLGGAEFETMKDNAVLVNVSRGQICDEDDLVAALEQRTIRGAALDVFHEEPLPDTSQLWDLSNVVITPHVAGRSPRGTERAAELFAENYRLFLEGDEDSFVNRVV